MVPMTQERGRTTDLDDLASTVQVARERIDSITARTRTHFTTLATPLAPDHSPSPAGGAAAPTAPVPREMLRRAVLHASNGLTGNQAEFGEHHTAQLAYLGRDLRKFGVTMQHYEAAAEAAGRAVCEEFGHPYPGVDLTYRRAAELGIPDGLTELLQAVDNAVRIVALGAVEDDEAGVPASLSATVLEVAHRTAQTTVVRLQASSPETGWAGQTLEVRPPAAPDEWQQYASALPPNQAGYLEFHCPASAGEPEVGETWVVANPTGGLGIPTGDDAPSDVVMIAVNSGLAALRALVMEVSGADDPPPVHLFWGADTSRDLHGLADLRGLERGFPWFTFTPVVTDEDHVTAAETALATTLTATHRGSTLVLVSGEDPDTVRDQVHVLTDAGVDPEQIIAEP
jgi:NAD(P)H-flavin reductase